MSARGAVCARARFRRAVAGLVVLAAGVGLSRAEPAPAASSQLTLTLRWQTVLPGAPIVLSSPNLARLDAAGRAVVVGARNGEVYALHLEDGSPVVGWPVDTGEPVDSSPAVADVVGTGFDQVFTGSGTYATVGRGGYLAFANTGTLLWSNPGLSPAYPTGAAVVASMAVGDLTGDGVPDAVAGEVGQAVYAFDAATGGVLSGWPYPATDSVYSSPALVALPGGRGGLDVVEGGDKSPGPEPDAWRGGTVRALDPEGQLLFHIVTDEVVTSSPAVGDLTGDGSVEIAFGTGFYWATHGGASDSTELFLASGSGQILWQRNLGGYTVASPALADLQGNGQLDVVEGTAGGPTSGEVFAYSPDGTLLPGFPVDPVPGSDQIVEGQVSTADLRCDGHQDLLIGTGQGLFGYSWQGKPLFQVGEGQIAIQSSPLVTVDRDGALGITVAGTVPGTDDGVVQHYELAGGCIGSGAWPQFRHDPELSGNAATPLGLGPDKPVSRLAGANRIGTALAVASRAFPEPGSAKAVVLAGDDEFPDALAGAPLAAAVDGPLLLTEPDELDPAVASEIAHVLSPGGTVYLLGGQAALSAQVASELEKDGYRTVRLEGSNRFGTAVAIADEIAEVTGQVRRVLLTTGLTFPDALAAGPVAAAGGGAILFTDGATEAPETAAFLSAHPSVPVDAIGGPAASADPSATPIVGSDRFATAAAVAAAFFPHPELVGLATGLDYPDALAAGAPLGSSTFGSAAPLLLSGPGAPLPAPVRSYLASRAGGITSAVGFGGPAALGPDALAALHAALDE